MKNKLQAGNCFMLILISLCFLTAAVYADAPQDPNRPVAITSWLKTDPVKQPMPVFNDIKNLAEETFELKDLLEFDPVNTAELWPKSGDAINWRPAMRLIWLQAGVDSNDIITLSETQTQTQAPQIAYLATYLHADRWIKTTLKIKSSHLLKAYLDGKEIISKEDSNKPAGDAPAKPGESSKEIKLTTGSHILIVKSLRDPKNSAPWDISASINLSKEFCEDDIRMNTNPKHRMDLIRLNNSTRIHDVSISGDADLVAVTLSKRYTEDKAETWLQIHRTQDASLVRSYRGGMKISSIKWAPKGKKFSFTSTDDKKQTLWVVDLEKGTTTALLKDVENLSGHSWSPTGSFIIYNVTQKPEEKIENLRRLKGMEDRQPTYRDRSFLYMVNVPEKTTRRLTSGLLSTNLNSISRNGSKILFTTSEPDYSERPYSKSEVFILNPVSMEIEKLWRSRWTAAGQFSPDGKKLLVTAGPQMFDGIGKNVSEGTIPNDYDGQAFIYDLATKQAEPITKNFNPAIDQAFWPKTGEFIYFVTIDTSYMPLHRYDLKKKVLEKIETGVHSVGKIDFAENKPVAVYTGSSATEPTKIYLIDLETKKYRLFLDPSKSDYQNLSLGNLEDFSFVNKQNVTVDGYVCYPPDFDPNKKYPCIVYYYSGTFPTPKGFGGSYSKNLYAAQGYIVYVLQPSGAIGFGQEFSAMHVNDWGVFVADEIIDGVKQFIAAHLFVDPDHIGCVGASYGGFMTMLLQTRTDIFAAAVSHAGISSISSYWGEGYWGYGYSAVAAADSFPWSRRDIFVDQSPLFSADKVTTPLLLLHGAKDTNVPPGESIQMYTALKLLGKEVEFIEIIGENHGIVDHKKRVLWMKSTLAWFDRYLKDQPNWWNDMYKK